MVLYIMPNFTGEDVYRILAMDEYAALIMAGDRYEHAIPSVKAVPV